LLNFKHEQNTTYPVEFGLLDCVLDQVIGTLHYPFLCLINLDVGGCCVELVYMWCWIKPWNIREL